ncbi:MAG: PEP-CTERM sorting domain-containing protein [Verrucomicrobiota bacterium]
MPKSPRTTTRLDQKLLTITLGSAAAAGASLPEKAEATALLPSGIIVNNDVLTAIDSINDRINIQLNLTDLASPIDVITVSSFGIPGWNFNGYFYSASTRVGMTFFGATASNSGLIYSYLFLTGTYFTATASVDISGFSESDFTYSTGILVDNSPDTLYFALRRTSNGGPDINGWVQLQFGSVTHLQSAFNFSDPSSITVGQVPEPSSALLLAAGATGLLTARRRRKKAA